MFVGEQPGDQEDLAGRPFVGPAGQMFDRALERPGSTAPTVYVTNAVKHFKFEQRGKRRIHKKPDAGEIEACRWWLEQERELIRPPVIVALGRDRGAITVRQDDDDRQGARRAADSWPTAASAGSPSTRAILLRIPEEDRRREERAMFVARPQADPEARRGACRLTVSANRSQVS